jgi:Immunity protein 50
MTEIQSSAFNEISGHEHLTGWFGYWPNFHDAQLLGIDVNTDSTSCVRVYTWEATKDDIDAQEYYILHKHLVVSFFLHGLKDVQLDGFDRENILMRLTVERTPEGLELYLDTIYGVGGIITAESIRVEAKPGIPPEAIHG